MKKIFILTTAVLLMLSIALTSTSCSCAGNNSGSTAATNVATEPDYVDENGMGYKLQSDGTLQVTVSGNGTDVVIPSDYKGMKVTSIGKSTFKMADVKTVTLPDTITNISDYAFAFSSTLEEINIPEGITTIGTNTFSGCINLRKIELPSTLTTIGIFAFDGSGLQEITIPENVEKIDEYAFAECSSLKTVKILSNDAEIAETVFSTSDNVIIEAHKKSTAIDFAKEQKIDYTVI